MYSLVKDFMNSQRSLELVCERYQVISFDIFGTLIKRECGNPQSIFDLVELRYNSMNSPMISDFRSKRILAEKKARRNSLNEEITLNDIYKELSESFDSSVCDRLMIEECNIELEQCIPNKAVVNLYSKLLNDTNKTLYITSDMYLPLELIHKLLIKDGINLPHRILLSCAENRTKRSGSIFNLLIDDCRIPSSAILHIGDNFKSDFIRPILSGLHAYYLR